MEAYLDQPDRGYKRVLVFLAAAAACAAVAAAGFVSYITPVDYVGLDVNPSVEFSLNLFGRVLTAKAYNWDGELLLGTDSYTHRTLDSAVCEVVGAACRQGYLAEDGSTAIAVAAESGSAYRADRWIELSEEAIQLALNARQHAAVLYSERLALGQRTLAREAGISPGRYSLIERLRLLDPAVEPLQYRNAGITDMLLAAGQKFPATEMWQEGQTGALERIRQTAGQIELQRSGAEMVLGSAEPQDAETGAASSPDGEAGAGSGEADPQTGTRCGCCPYCGCACSSQAGRPRGR